jgi:hypothetical protein
VAVVGALLYLGRCIAAWVASAELREGFPISIVANAIQAGTYAFAALVLLLFSRRRRATVA